MLSKSAIKLNRRGFIEIVLVCVLLALALYTLWHVGLWYWQTQLAHGQATSMGRSAEAPLIPYILRHPAMMLSVTFAGFMLLLAIALMIVPVSWWLHTDRALEETALPVMTPMSWLAKKMGLARAPQLPTQGMDDEVAGIYIVNEAGERVFVPQANEQSEVEEDANQEVIMVEQPDGTLLAMVQQADGTLVPAKKKSGSKENTEQADEVDPLASPETPLEGFTFEEEEEDTLLDLADIDDIINSAFDDDGPIDLQRQALSQSLDEVDIDDLLADARDVLATFKR